MLGPIDPRDRDLARTLVNYSCQAKPGELVFIQCNGLDALGLATACVEETARAGAAPYLHLVEPETQRAFLHAAGADVFKRLARFELKQMQDADCFIGIRGSNNAFEMSDVPRATLDAYSKHVVKPVHMEERVKRTRWVVLRYPNPAMAQMANASTAAFADFYYAACLADFPKMAKAVQPLKRLMEQTDKVRLTGQGYDLAFSIKGIGAVPCVGERNIPDGECFTAPVRNSVEGTVHFNSPTLWEGAAYEDIRLTFRKGKVVEATAADARQTERLNQVLDQDPGARYVGEWSLGFHPAIMEPMRDILFDEKIAGSFHIALGQCYDEASNGNKSALHWDMVAIQRPDKGGGEVWFDGKVIRRDGVFLPKELRGLNG